MVDDVSRRGVLLSAGAALSGGIATGIGSGTVTAGTDGRGQDEVPPVRWHETVDNDNMDKLIGIGTAEGQLTVDGYSGVVYESVDPWAATVDATDGSLRSQTRVDVDGQFLTQASAPLAEGGRVFLGRHTEEPDADDATTEPTLVGTNGDGGTAWRRAFEPPFELFQVTDLAADPTGGAVFVGYSLDIDNPNTWAAAVDAEGETRWERRLAGFFATFATGIEPTGDGYLVYGNAMRGEQWDFDRQDGWAAKIGPTGDPQWSERYRQRSGGGQSEYHRFTDVVETESGYLLVGDLAPSADDAAARGWAVTVDSDGQRLYTALDRPGTDGGGEFVAAVPYGDGYALVGSTYRSEERLVEIPWVRCVDASLSNNWEALDPLGRPAIVRDAVATSDGGVALTGNHDTVDGWTDPFVAKLGGDPVETPTPSPTPTPTPTRTPSPTPTATQSSAPTESGAQPSTRTPTEADEAAAGPDTTAGDGPGFGVSGALAALCGGTLLSRWRREPTDEE
ncbi:PGF-CTERM sorting domain-containing protein [Halosimplex sp. TS25]|uniref:PGF-CTERM sorting domain-containing protein n=1 Tax=Halosimplex rarum TaxID=3396619 RepID=UPI0039EAC805